MDGLAAPVQSGTKVSQHFRINEAAFPCTAFADPGPRINIQTHMGDATGRVFFTIPGEGGKKEASQLLKPGVMAHHDNVGVRILQLVNNVEQSL